MNTQAQAYLAIRQDLQIPASHALRMLRGQNALAARMEATGFRWQEGRSNTFARWKEEDFELRATVTIDEDGWWTSGVDYVGQFVSKWRPGAIKHHQGGRNSLPWFLPANPEYGREDYRRACEFGRTWWYVLLEVSAYRANIKLGSACLCGIEQDASSDSLYYFSETAFDLADQAIAEANQKLQALCGCH